MRNFIPILLILAACNSSDRQVESIEGNSIVDSLSIAVDSAVTFAKGVDTLLRNYAQVFAEVKELRKAKREQVEQLERTYPTFSAVSSDDEHLKRINELNNKLAEKEFEIAKLKRQIYYDSLYRTRPVGKIDRVPNEIQPIRPDENSIILQLDRKIKGDGDIPIDGLSVYIIPYNKRAKKWKEYGYCSGLDGKQADLYNGEFFFNDIPPGKYLIKVCTYLGGYKIIERTEGLQVVAMQVAPPIQ